MHEESNHAEGESVLTDLAACKQAHHFILGSVGVLELIHQDVLVALLHTCAHFWALLQQSNRPASTDHQSPSLCSTAQLSLGVCPFVDHLSNDEPSHAGCLSGEACQFCAKPPAEGNTAVDRCLSLALFRLVVVEAWCHSPAARQQPCGIHSTEW